MDFLALKPLENAYLESLGFSWHTNSDLSAYISSDAVVVTNAQAQAYYEAANELYDMFVAAAQYVIDNNLFHELGIPFNLVDTIKLSWENDVHWHLYGRFDFAGGLDGAPIKLLEFNADTPTALLETAVVQWALLKYNGLDESRQFNDIYDALVANFKRLVTLHGDPGEFERRYEGWRVLFSSIAGNDEDEMTTKFLQVACDEAGFETAFCFADEAQFDDREGIFYGEQNYEFWFKLIPWEMIATDESELAMMLQNIIANQKAIILNPAYTLLFQSKGILKILWELYPNHPLLLRADTEPLGIKQVRKPFFGREGANVAIMDAGGKIITENDGEYANGRVIYQEFAELNAAKGQRFQAGVFFAYEACGLGFRAGGDIIDNYAKFIGHILK